MARQMAAVRTFNTAGPVQAHRHCQIAPLSRIDLDEVLGLIRDEKYLVLHAPRQTGKTSALLALRDLPNGGQVGDFRCGATRQGCPGHGVGHVAPSRPLTNRALRL